MLRPISQAIHRQVHRLASPLGRHTNALSGTSLRCAGTTRNTGSRQTYSTTAPLLAETVSITYVEADGTEKEVKAEIGKNLMEVAHDNNVELEGACGGELACSTCHLIFEQEIYDSLPEKDDEEDDMLDLAFEVTETSRLGCQICVTKDFEGMTVKIPDDGF